MLNLDALVTIHVDLTKKDSNRLDSAKARRVVLCEIIYTVSCTMNLVICEFKPLSRQIVKSIRCLLWALRSYKDTQNFLSIKSLAIT